MSERRDLRSLLVFLGVASAIALVGEVPRADNVTHRVLALVDGIAWADWYKPFTMPPPIEAVSLRPLSVLLLKAHVAVFGSVQPPPMYMSVAKSVLTLVALGTGARAWLIAMGLPRWGMWAGLTTMLLAPNLFETWTYPEFDNLGAAGTLWAGAMLVRGRALGARWVVVALGLSTALLMKEATALVQFGFLGAAGLGFLLRGRREIALRHGVIALACIAFWALLAVPVMEGPSTRVGSTDWMVRLWMLEHNFAQILYLASPAGAALIAAGAAASILPKVRGHVSLGLVVAALVLLLASPIAVFYSHYEAVYYTPRGFAIGWSAALWAGLILVLLGRDRELSMVTLHVVAAVGMLTLAGLFAPTAREDMASRIFIVVAPLLHAMTMEFGARLWRQVENKLGRATLTACVVVFAWYPLASGVNYTLDWRARQRTDFEAKKTLAALPLDNRLVLFNHFVQWVGPHELRAVGASDLRDRAFFLQTPAWISAQSYRNARWIGTTPFAPGFRFDLDGAVGAGLPGYLVWFTRRSEMHPIVNARLAGTLAWTRRPYGLFSPIVASGHNRAEDQRWTTFRTGPSPLEVWAGRQGPQMWEVQRGFVQFPLHLSDVIRRLESSVPLVERYRYEAQVIRLNPQGDEVEMDDIKAFALP